MHCDLDLWPFDLKIYRAHPCLMGSLHVKFHDDRCKGKAVMRRKPKYGRTDRRTWFIQYTPPNFVAGGINIALEVIWYCLWYYITNTCLYNKTQRKPLTLCLQTDRQMGIFNPKFFLRYNIDNYWSSLRTSSGTQCAQPHANAYFYALFIFPTRF